MRYIGIDFMFGLPVCRGSVTFAGLENIVRYTQDFVI